MSISFRMYEEDWININGIENVLENYDEMGVIMRDRDD